jgi:hypothetical protein
MPTGHPGVDQDGRRSGPAFHITQSLATGDVVILPIAAMAPSLYWSSRLDNAIREFIAPSIHGSPSTRKPSPKSTAFSKSLPKRLINGKRINARAKERGAQKTPVKSQLLQGGDGDVREILRVWRHQSYFF